MAGAPSGDIRGIRSISGRALRSMLGWVLGVLAVALWSVAATASLGVTREGLSGWVDETGCADCHADVVRQWRGSQHARALQPAAPDTVIGDFAGGAVPEDPEMRFERRGDRFRVVARDADGQARRLDVTHTFGVHPLQQYLVGGPRGRLQALTVAWDTVRNRWFSLYPDLPPAPGDARHWAGPGANWNTMCAACHSSGVRKRYDATADRYDTLVATLGVGCQGCHGPAKRHLDIVRSGRGNVTAKNNGFDATLARTGPGQLDACAQCHAFRTALLAQHDHGKRFLDQYLPVLLTESNYFADGSQQGEVFVWGSWLQSRMHQQGLVCGDCHEPHAGALRAGGDALCVSCHSPTGPDSARVRAGIDFSGLVRKDYASVAHHRHSGKVPSCVDCHAGHREYMVVDARLDHAFRIPRPDVALRTGSPDPCTACHRDRDAAWAAAAITGWTGAAPTRAPHYGEAFAAARRPAAGAVEGLLAVARDAAQPAIVRATALQALATFPGARAARTLKEGARDADPLVRLGALYGAAALPQEAAAAFAGSLLADPVRAVRVAAAGALLGSSVRSDPQLDSRLQRALGEYEAAQRENADRPEGLVNLARVALHRGNHGEAEGLLRLAVARHPHFVPARRALAELLASSAGEAVAERLLREGLERFPNEPALYEALGQSLVRQRRYSDAEAVLEVAAAHGEGSPSATLLHAMLVAERADIARAVALLRQATRRHGERRELLVALAALQRRAGAPEEAHVTLQGLAAVNPDDPALSPR
ncbi:doubled CXXCH domain-containing protein [Aromatoleum tolulyticum]|uniref:Doubled CXXCH domain-containing protein n=1 Tax=Aromatoleum tolulyticum TaxID=34027 RepID=A0A1N6QBP2_9RHOO|nr:doubled CXXCH domain-containing protein [Aromatoleum tolulyticum]